MSVVTRAIVVICVSAASVLGGCSGAADENRAASSTLSPAERGAVVVGANECASCHQTSKAEVTLAGNAAPLPGTKAFPANLTPDPETGIGKWTDAQILRAIREGLDDHGQPLCGVMPRFPHIGDADGAAIVAYLRSLPPVRNEVPQTECAADGAM